MTAPRLTSDITIRGRPLTSRQYAAHIQLLREFASAPISAWRATTLDESDVWIALHRQGLIRNRPDGLWDVVELTPYGELYLSQRTEAAPLRA